MIRVEDLTKRYGDVRAVDGVTFQIESGEVVGLLGPNGAGKSTTMRILTGFLHPDSGRVEIDGRDVDPEQPESKRAVGYLPESTPLYRRMRVAEYLDFVGRVRRLSRAGRRDALERVLFDCDLLGWSQRRIAHLSRGYRQRVGLAQALLPDPPVLILDEPTSGLDPAEIARIRALIQELGRTKTVLLSTHILAEVQETCPRVIILADGKVVADGSTLDLAANESVELHVTLDPGDADAQAAVHELRALECVRGLRTLGADDAGRVRFALAVDDRYAAAAAVSAALQRRGWTLFELRHDLPSLERVFLQRTETHVLGFDPDDEEAPS